MLVLLLLSISKNVRTIVNPFYYLEQRSSHLYNGLFTINHLSSNGVALPGFCFCHTTSNIIIQWVYTGQNATYTESYCNSCKYVILPNMLYNFTNLNRVNRITGQMYMDIMNSSILTATDIINGYKCKYVDPILTFMKFIKPCRMVKKTNIMFEQHIESIVQWTTFKIRDEDNEEEEMQEFNVQYYTPAVFNDMFVYCQYSDQQHNQQHNQQDNQFISYITGNTFKSICNNIGLCDNICSSVQHVQTVRLKHFNRMYYNLTSIWIHLLYNACKHNYFVNVWTALTRSINRVKTAIRSFINLHSVIPLNINQIIDHNVLLSFIQTYKAMCPEFPEFHIASSKLIYIIFEEEDNTTEELAVSVLDYMRSLFKKYNFIYGDGLRQIYQLCTYKVLLTEANKWSDNSSISITDVTYYLHCLSIVSNTTSSIILPVHSNLDILNVCNILFGSSGKEHNGLHIIDRMSNELGQNVFTPQVVYNKCLQLCSNEANMYILRLLYNATMFGLI